MEPAAFSTETLTSFTVGSGVFVLQELAEAELFSAGDFPILFSANTSPMFLEGAGVDRPEADPDVSFLPNV